MSNGVFEALEKRKSIRHFRPDPISDDILRKLVYAARRAPTVGNAPFRRLMVIKDKKMLRLLKQVSPGILGEPAALMVIYTDLDVAKTLRKLGDVCATIDAGAAAENVTLAATSLGLGSCFTKSYSEGAVKEILGIPDGYRTEVIMQLGYAQENQPAPMKAREGADSVHLDKFGNNWE